jgi:DNA invertase Pin-like site-specific DNA recombinase
MRKYVIYTRVSTDEQGKSGLGLEAQQRDIELFLHGYSEIPWAVVERFTEVASGADDDRPVLREAIGCAKRTNAELLVAKLDRLSRKVSFLANLMDDRKLQIRVASMPAADKFQLHIYAALAEQEREFISSRTKAALKAAKARGVKLGGDRHGALEAANERRLSASTEHAVRVAEIARPMREAGTPLATIAEALNAQGMRAAGGGAFTATAVKRLLARAGEAALVAAQEAERARFAALQAKVTGRYGSEGGRAA